MFPVIPQKKRIKRLRWTTVPLKGFYKIPIKGSWRRNVVLVSGVQHIGCQPEVSVIYNVIERGVTSSAANFGGNEDRAGVGGPKDCHGRKMLRTAVCIEGVMPWLAADGRRKSSSTTKNHICCTQVILVSRCYPLERLSET